MKMKMEKNGSILVQGREMGEEAARQGVGHFSLAKERGVGVGCRLRVCATSGFIVCVQPST